MKLRKGWYRNYYVIIGFCFITWLTFFDSNDLYTQFRLSQKLNGLKAEKAYYVEKIDEVKADRKELFSNNDLLEKFAREKYLMKKPSEDLFVVIEE